MKGGAGATSHGLSTYGGIDEQHAVGPRDNMIAMKQITGGKGVVLSPHVFSNNKSKKSEGGRGRVHYKRPPPPSNLQYRRTGRRGCSRKRKGTRKARR
jgi:hypothetical protein